MATLVQAPTRTRLDARNDLAVRREHEDMTERGVADEQATLVVHGQAIRTTRTEGGAEAADLGDAAIFHERGAPHRVVARHGDEQHAFGGIKHEAVRADAGVDEAIELAARTQPIDTPGRIVQAGLALIGEIDVAIFGEMQVVAALEQLRVARGQHWQHLACAGIELHDSATVVGDENAPFASIFSPLGQPSYSTTSVHFLSGRCGRCGRTECRRYRDCRRHRRTAPR